MRMRDGAAGFLVPLLGFDDSIARREPFDGKVVVRIGETGAGLPRARALVVVVVSLPRDVGDFVDLGLGGFESRIVEARQETTLEFGLVELNARHAATHSDIGHGNPLMQWGHGYVEMHSK